MSQCYNISEAKSKLPSLIKKVQATESVIAIKKQGHNAIDAYLISGEQMETMLETLEVLNNPTAMKAIHAFEKGKTKFLSADEIKKL